MGIFDRLFRRKSSAPPAPTRTQEEIRAECPHTTLMGRWDSVDDMGKEEKITAFICDSCRTTFTPEEGRQLRGTTAERLRTEDIERARQRAEAAEERESAGQ